MQDKKEQIKQQRKQEFDAELLRLNIVVKPWARDYYNRYVDQVADDDGEVPTMEDTIAHLKKFVSEIMSAWFYLLLVCFLLFFGCRLISAFFYCFSCAGLLCFVVLQDV